MLLRVTRTALAPTSHKGFVAVHAKDPLRRACITEVFDFALAVATLEAVGAESLVAGQNGEIFDFVAA